VTNQTQTLIQYRLEKAADTLDAARILLREGKTLSAVNRIYYAMFYAVSALLMTKGLASFKHSGILSLFSQEIVNKNLIDKESGRFYNRMFRYRQKGDYQDFVQFDPAQVNDWIVRADRFIKTVGELVASNQPSPVKD
jgi:uncharacterized protein